MTVARAAQDEVEAVRKEMQEKVKAAQEATGRQVRAITHRESCHRALGSWFLSRIKIGFFWPLQSDYAATK